MAEQRIETRLYLAAELAPGAELHLDPARAHFLRSVLRLEAGARLAAFNARDGEWLARIEGLGKSWCAIRIETLRRAPEPEPDLWLVFAPIKRAHIDFLAEKVQRRPFASAMRVLGFAAAVLAAPGAASAQDQVARPVTCCAPIR